MPDVKAIATSKIEKTADESVALAINRIFPQPEIHQLDIADGLKQLLYEKNWDLRFLLQSDATSVARELGIEEFVAKIIIDAAKIKMTE
jgi:hypothetical protein